MGTELEGGEVNGRRKLLKKSRQAARHAYEETALRIEDAAVEQGSELFHRAVSELFGDKRFPGKSPAMKH